VAAAIEVQHVSKHFRLYHERYSSLKERALHLGHIPFDDFEALVDVSFNVDQGTTFGLLGHNGSGKSTLLKCITGILRPSGGEIRTRGRVAALLELGAGFHPDLTGRENVFLNASLLGMSHRQIESRFDDIVDFAELEPFIDNQVKYYSSGMYVRLGFAVAVNMDPEILIVDEVLSVGDELFQRKCLDRVRQFQREGRTILLVTHSADMVRQICSSAAVLDKGHLVALGPPGEAIRSFREHLLQRQADAEAAHLAAELATHLDGAGAKGEPSRDDGTNGADSSKHGTKSSAVEITHVKIEYPADPSRRYLCPGDPLTIHVGYEALQPVEDLVAGVAAYGDEGKLLFAANNLWYPIEHGVLHGPGEFLFEFPSVPLLDGTYSITIGLTTADEGTVYDWHDQKYHFQVMNPTRASGLVHMPPKISLHPSTAVEQQQPAVVTLGQGHHDG
jgi:ABC-2 type transport system ATP-binding protein